MANKKLIYVAILSALGLSACGGGSGGGSTLAAKDTTVTGVITGFGSVFVDGVEYETNDSTFDVDGNSATEDDLAVGMVVTLTGRVNADGSTGLASSVVFSNDIEGVVISNNYLSNGTMNIMGQTVKIDAETVFESKVLAIATLDQIVAGNVVEISGYPTAAGVIYATRVEVKSASKIANAVMEVKGVVSSLDDVAQTFVLGSLTIDYSAAIFERITSLSNGLYVEVKSNQALNGTTLMASKVELENEGSLSRSGDDGDELEFEGVIVSLGDNNSFTLNGQTVFYSSSTEFEFGTSADLVVDKRVKVEGRFNANGDLLAREIKFRMRSETEVSGLIESIDMTNKTVTVMGTAYHVSNNTIMRDDKDESNGRVRYFDLGDVSTGDLVEIKSYKDVSTDKLLATKFERDDYDSSDLEDAWSVEGRVEQIDLANDTMVIAGVSVDFSSFPSFSAAVGAKVEVEGSYANNVLVATEIGFDD